jgi:hypothetical protein
MKNGSHMYDVATAVTAPTTATRPTRAEEQQHDGRDREDVGVEQVREHEGARCERGRHDPASSVGDAVKRRERDER